MTKRVTATEARRHWFRLLDEVAAGEEVVIERHGCRIVLRRSEFAAGEEGVPDYPSLIRAPDVTEADRWGWEWPGPESDREPRPRGRE